MCNIRLQAPTKSSKVGDFTLGALWYGRMRDGWTDGHETTKIYRMDRKPKLMFLAMGLHLHMICSTKKLYWMLSLNTFFQVLSLLA